MDCFGFSVPMFNFEIIRCRRFPLGFSRDAVLAAGLPEGGSKSSGGPVAKKSIKSRVVEDTLGVRFCAGGIRGTGGSTSSSSDPFIMSSKSIDSRALCFVLFRTGPLLGESEPWKDRVWDMLGMEVEVCSDAGNAEGALDGRTGFLFTL
jgi:hypothetical protein